MQHVAVGMCLRAFTAIALFLACVGSGIAIHILYSPAWVHIACCSAVLAAEVVFAVHYAWLHSKFQSSPQHRSCPEANNPQKTVNQLLRHLRHVGDMRTYLKSWFLGSELLDWDQDIRRDNLKELYAYALWYRTLDQMEAEGLLGDIEQLLQQLEHYLGSRVAEGYNPKLKFMSHLWEPIKHVYRPLLFYGVMEFLAAVQYVALTAAGFKMHDMGGVSYFTYKMPPQQLATTLTASIPRKDAPAPTAAAAAAPAQPGSQHHQSVDQQPADQQQQYVGSQPGPAAEAAGCPEQLPLVFLHGVGAGLLPYLMFVFNLASLGRPMICVESKHVSMRLVRWLPTVDDMADATAAILKAHGSEQAVVVAHSYGTFVASRLVNKFEGSVHSLCLMDPVCFAMFMPDLVKNFMYARHKSGCLFIDIIMALVSTELHCRTVFSRQFFWTSVNMWEDAIPERTLVVLSGRDILAPTAHLNKWLSEHTHAQVLHKPGMAHAGVLVNVSWQDIVIEAFKQLIDRPAGSPAAAAAVAAAEEVDTAEQVAAAADECQQQQLETGQLQELEYAAGHSCDQYTSSSGGDSSTDDTAYEDHSQNVLLGSGCHHYSSSDSLQQHQQDCDDIGGAVIDKGLARDTESHTDLPVEANHTEGIMAFDLLDAAFEDEVYCIAKPQILRSSKGQLQSDIADVCQQKDSAAVFGTTARPKGC